VGQDNQFGVRSDRFGDLPRFDKTPLGEGHQVKEDQSLLLKVVEGAQDRVVFQAGTHDMTAGLDQAQDKGVEGVSGIVGKAEMITVISTEEPAQPPADGVDAFMRCHCQVIAAASGRAAHFQVQLEGSAKALGRLGIRGGGIIEIDHHRPPSRWPTLPTCTPGQWEMLRSTVGRLDSHASAGVWQSGQAPGAFFQTARKQPLDFEQ